MRLAILTTATPHHVYFLQAISQRHDVALIAVETAPRSPPFPTEHPAEQLRDAYEIETWFNGKVPPLKSFGPCVEAASINDAAVHRRMVAVSPDVTIAFGCGKVGIGLINLAPEAIWNLHGGDPERFRGLDSHLWACLKKDFSALVTCLHKLRADLDTGEIILRRSVPLRSNMPFFKLRRFNAELCATLVLEALAAYEVDGIEVSPQGRRGHYFSFMPASVKTAAIANFEEYVSRL